MESREYPFYGIGIIAYGVASADGVIQGREKLELQSMIREWSKEVEVGFDVTEIIFTLFVKTADPKDLTYEKGLEYIRRGRSHLTERLKEKFVFLINDIAHAFPPVTDQEKALVRRLKSDLKSL